MSACDALTANASLGAAPALRAVDCLANEAAASAFGRLFGSDGALLPALTILLTLYIAFFAISLLTGRSRLGISALTPRMMTLGLVLTFATSWAAWQGVVWNLAVGAPDQIAGVLMGANGSATQIFADHIDMVFAAIAEVADAAIAGQAQATPGMSGSFTPGNLMWLGALLLLLGTVGVLVTSRIALAVLLALGPVFVVLALFSGTRGLTAGWLRGVVLTAVTPLFVVLGGSLMLEMLVPVIASLGGVEGVDGRAALALFLIASVHVALMAMVLKVAGSIVSGWQVFGLAMEKSPEGNGGDADAGLRTLAGHGAAVMASPALAGSPRRMAPLVPAMAAASGLAAAATSSPGHAQASGVHMARISGAAPGMALLPARRGRGIGSRFASGPSPYREMFR